MAQPRNLFELAQGHVPGLPALSGRGSHSSAQRARRSADLGATATNLFQRAGSYVASVSGAPSIQLESPQMGGVEATLRRNLDGIELLEKDDYFEANQVMDEIVALARNLSHGPFKQQQLNELGHPYKQQGRAPLPRAMAARLRHARGVRGWVPSLTIVNEQSGDLADSWYGRISVDEGGVNWILGNSSPESVYVAYGTNRMIAHGPFTYALLQYENRIASVMGKLQYGIQQLRQALADSAAQAESNGEQVSVNQAGEPIEAPADGVENLLGEVVSLTAEEIEEFVVAGFEVFLL